MERSIWKLLRTLLALFIVKTSTIEVKVLGTRFNVCAYRDEPAASVVLVEGQVEVKNGDNGKNVLSPDDMLELKGKEIFDQKGRCL